VPPKQKEQKAFPRKRCANCPKFFSQTKPNKRFHSNACRIEFNNNKSGFGKLRELLPKMVAREVAEQLRNLLSADTIELLDTISQVRRTAETADIAAKLRQLFQPPEGHPLYFKAPG